MISDSSSVFQNVGNRLAKLKRSGGQFYIKEKSGAIQRLGRTVDLLAYGLCGSRYVVHERTTGRLLLMKSIRGIQLLLPILASDIERRGLDVEPQAGLPFTLTADGGSRCQNSWEIPRTIDAMIRAIYGTAA